MQQSNSVRLTIRSNWDISMIEKSIEDYMPNCTFWGDLNITAKEYENLASKFKEALGDRPDIADLKRVMKKYPFVFITDITSFILYEYNVNFWEAWTSKFGLELNANHQGEIGKFILENFRKYDFEFIEDGYIYVSTILYQAGIPAVSFNRLFEAVDSTLNSVSLTSRDLVNELIGYKSNYIDVTVRRHFERNEEQAIELVDNLRDLMRTNPEPSENVEILGDNGIPDRVLQQYKKWYIESQNRGRRNKKNFQFYISPKLFYDEIKGVCLYLPEQTLRDDSIYNINWVIESKNPAKKMTAVSGVHFLNRQNFSTSTYVPINPAEDYRITLFDEDNADNPLTSPWEIDGISEHNPLMIFGENGFLIPRTQASLSRRGTTIVYCDDFAKAVQKNALNSEDLYLTNAWRGYSAVRVYPFETDSSFQIEIQNSKFIIRYKNNFEFELGEDGILFDEKYYMGEVPVYSNFPELRIYGVDKHPQNDLSNLPEKLSSWHIILNNKSTNEKMIVGFQELLVSATQASIGLSINSPIQQKLSGKYGLYDIRIYEGKDFKKQFLFYHSPNIRIQGETEELPSENKIGLKQAVFYMEKKDFEMVEFDPNCVNIKTNNEKLNNWVEIRLNSARAYITGSIILLNSIKIPFKKTVRKLEWSLWNETQNNSVETSKNKVFYTNDFKENTWRLKVHFTNTNEFLQPFSLALRAADGTVLQEKECSFDNKGNSYITLNMFHETIERFPLPQCFTLLLTSHDGNQSQVNVGPIKSFIQLRKPNYKVINGKETIFWEKNPNNQLKDKQLELVSLNDLDMEPIRKSLDKISFFSLEKGKEFEGIHLDEPINDGAYFIDAIDSEKFSFFEDEETTAPSYDRNHLLIINGERYFERHYELSLIDSQAWLEAAVVAQDNEEWINKLADKLKGAFESTTIRFDSDRSAQILFSLVLNTQKETELKPVIKTKIKEIYKLIGDFTITSAQRMELLKILLESNVTDDEIRYIIKELQLYLFVSNQKDTFDKALLYKMWNIQEEIAVLINLRDCANSVSVDIDRVIDRIGEESLTQMIKFQKHNACNSENWTECFECIVSNQGLCENASFENSERIWGDGSEHGKLFVIDRKNNVSFREPVESDTNGYSILGRTYLKLIVDTIQQHQNKERIDNSNEVRQEFNEIDTLVTRFKANFKDVENILYKRSDSSSLHLYFMEVGRASLLQALESRDIVPYHQTKRLLPFWRYAMASCPELGYRDMIVSELYTIINREGK